MKRDEKFLIKLIEHTFQMDNLKPSDRFYEELYADSLDMVELLMLVEMEWDIEIDDYTWEFHEPKTIRDMWKLINVTKEKKEKN